MARIKSALELALERTDSIKGDKAGIEQFEAKRTGKRLVNEYLDASASTPKQLEEAIKKAPKEQRHSMKEGMFEILLARINPPVTKDDEKCIEAVGKGLQAIMPDAHLSAMYKQLREVLSRYLDEIAHYDEAIRQQYAPTLKRKEEELARRTGQQIKLDPFQDPEFVVFYNQNMDALKANYQAAVDQVRAEASRVWAEVPV